MLNSKILLLSKINDSRFIHDMYENEYLYFNWLDEFRKNENIYLGRNDPRELNINTQKITNLKINFNEKEYKLHELSKDFKGELNEYLSDTKINCCSLHWIEIEPHKISDNYDEKLLSLGDKMIIIYDVKKFFEILDSSLESLNFSYSRKKVNYYDPKIHNNKLTLHDKDKNYCWQNEYRILIMPSLQKPIKIPLPGLKEISIIINTIDYKLLKIEFAS